MTKKTYIDQHDLSRLRQFWSRGSGRKLNAGRQSAYDKVMSTQGLDVLALLNQKDAIDPQALFSQQYKAYRVEIGFGNGEYLATQAQNNPDIGFIGCEPFLNGVSALCVDIQKHHLSNILIWQEDGRLLLHHLSPGSIARVDVLFPDPWPKTRHHKRRFIQKNSIDSIVSCLHDKGLLRMATDHPELAQWMLSHGLRNTDLNWCAQSCHDWQHPPSDWVETRYQKKAKASPKTWYIEFTKNA